MDERASAAGPPPPYGWCPNCSSGEVVQVSGGPGPRDARNVVALTAFSGVSIARLICLSCGSVREWVENPADLAKLREKYGWQLHPGGHAT